MSLTGAELTSHFLKRLNSGEELSERCGLAVGILRSPEMTTNLTIISLYLLGVGSVVVSRIGDEITTSDSLILRVSGPLIG